MRLSRLSLERYGRFEDCELNFRPGIPDLHIIYGENEAGKTTSLAAVSDLLFGFPVRSPYNFLFDYSLLRVGAVLEDGGTTLACRRKKGTSGTLLGADDIPIDEAPLAAMLRGQTRIHSAYPSVSIRRHSAPAERRLWRRRTTSGGRSSPPAPA
jgi:hypothetical protein